MSPKPCECEVVVGRDAHVNLVLLVHEFNRLTMELADAEAAARVAEQHRYDTAHKHRTVERIIDLAREYLETGKAHEVPL